MEENSITERIPNTWQDLQNEVAKLLTESGVEAETDKKMITPRGEVSIDVYAEEVIDERKYTIICECKHWRKNIPQTVIHSFRTVVGDIGSNKGYVISLNGFQSGAYNNVYFTNIELLDWNGFQAIILNSWLLNYFVPVITKELDQLFEYSLPINSSVDDKVKQLSENNKVKFRELQKKYSFFGMFVYSSYSKYANVFSDEKKYPKLPASLPEKQLQELPSSILKAKSYRELLDETLKFGKQVISELDAFFVQSS